MFIGTATGQGQKVIISVAIHVLKAFITLHYKKSFSERIFTIETKEDLRISASEIKVIQPKASKNGCLFSAFSYYKVIRKLHRVDFSWV